MIRALAVTAILLLAASATIAQAQESVDNASQESGQSAVAMGQLSVAGVKVVAGSVALPIMLAGSTATAGGSAVAELGSDMWQSANAPLEVSPETIVAQPAPQVPYDAQPVSHQITNR